MTPLQLIEIKRDGGVLDPEHWQALVSSVLAGEMTRYQVAAFNVAVSVRGLAPIERGAILGVLAAEGLKPEWLEMPDIGVDIGLYGGHPAPATAFYHPILRKKLASEHLTQAEIQAFIAGMTAKTVPDEAVAAFTMAVYLKGMTAEETRDLTLAMLHSGTKLQWPGLEGLVVDKHSTGGVGDKISLPLAGALIACGLHVPMLSGRGLGHTGGTLDKLQAIPGYRVDLSPQEIDTLVRTVGGMIIGQTSDLAPADRKMYAIRDVCGTVSSIPLITASILSKKLAEGLDALVLDVKVGDGAFMKTVADAQALATSLATVGTAAGVTVTALLTQMDSPIGEAVGNANEVRESVRCLKGEGPADVELLVVALGAELLLATKKAPTLELAADQIRATLHNGTAWQAFQRMVQAQGGSLEALNNPALLADAPLRHSVTATKQGFLTRLAAEKVGRAVVALGGGRLRQEDLVDPNVGIHVYHRPGDAVEAGEVLLDVFARDSRKLKDALELLESAIEVDSEPPARSETILMRIASGA